MEQGQKPEVWSACENGVWMITLNRPQVLNALTIEMFYQLREEIEQAERAENADVVVLRGAGGNFCSGADLSVLAVLREDTQADEALRVINEFLTRLHRMPKPVISVIEGAAVGAGLNLALHADFVIATNNALLQEPFVHLGLTTDFGGTYMLPRLVGLAHAKRLALLGERLSGQEAERIGFIYKAVDAERLAEEVEKLIMTVRRVPKQAYAVTKEGLGRAQGMELEQALEWEKEQQPRLIAHPDFLSLIAAKSKK